MKHKSKNIFLFSSLVLIFLLSGCGYTTKSLLPSDIKKVYVDNVKNEINVTAEQNNTRMYRGYMPGMEIELTNAIIREFLTEGTLKIANEPDADIVIRASLIDYKRDPLRYDVNDNIEEYRIKLIINMTAYNNKTGAVMWKEKGFAGETTYRTTGSLAISESQAIALAIQDLSRRVVERTVEAW